MKWELLDFSTNTQLTSSGSPHPSPHTLSSRVCVHCVSSHLCVCMPDRINPAPPTLSLSLFLPGSVTHTHTPLHTHRCCSLASLTLTHTKHTNSREGISWSTFVVLRNLIFCLHGGLPQTWPADSAGAEEHRQPPPNPLHQGNNCSRQRVSPPDLPQILKLTVLAKCTKTHVCRTVYTLFLCTMHRLPRLEPFGQGTFIHAQTHTCRHAMCAAEGPKVQHVLPLFSSFGPLTESCQHPQLFLN